ncbi:MAG: hypothetical protein KC503_33425 [Myxococcales bacterium]|nr:hypothetical protein [Myxococcales bacterium]
MTRQLPPFDHMWGSYPTYAKALSMGAGLKQWSRLKNTCGVRVSYCLNYCGHPIPAHAFGLRTWKGVDNKYYLPWMRDVEVYLARAYAPAERVGSQHDVSGRRGVIAFEGGFASVTGHVDLWNGSQAANNAYFGYGSTMFFWEAD